MMVVFRHFKQQHGVYISVTTASHLMLKKILSFKRGVGRHLPVESSMGKRNSHIDKGLHVKVC